MWSNAFTGLSDDDLQDEWIDYHRSVDKGHRKIEIRECYHSDEVEWLTKLKQFRGARSIGMVKATRIIGEKTSTQCRYYISSLTVDAQKFGQAVRAHWSVENTLHWTLDMTFREDESRMRNSYSGEDFAMMRRIALSIVKRDVESKRSLKRKRTICAYDNDYLERLLFNSDQALAGSSF